MAINNCACLYWRQDKIRDADIMYMRLLSNENVNNWHKLHYLNFLFNTANVFKVKEYLFSIEDVLLNENETKGLLILLTQIIKDKKCLIKLRKILDGLDREKHKPLSFIGPVVLAVSDYHTKKKTESLYDLSSEQQLMAKVLLSFLGYTPDEKLGEEDPALFFSRLSS